jgi:ACS family tartrate transporter-like MFS transporter
MTANTELAERALARISRRLIPFLFILYVFAYLDRVNVGYAALFIRRELNFSDTVYGTGAGLFFLSYAIFEVPSNLILMRVGSRRWIGILMVAWGFISASMPLARTPAEFYALRFLLGAAEAGFFPGIVLYFTAWFPKQLKARTLARFMSATAIAGVVGAPFSNLLLRLHGVAGIAGWKWLFVGEGVPSIFLGLLVFWVLTDTPADATWLPHDEQQWLIETLAAEQAGISATHSVHLREIWRNPAMWQLSAIYFLVSAGFYSLSLWLPVVLKQISGASASRVILLTAIPWAIATVVMLIIAHFSDKTQERRRFLAASLLAAMMGFGLSAWLVNPLLATASLSLAAAGAWGCLGPFWALPTTMLRGTAAAGGIAIINSAGALGGFCGPYLMGIVSDATHSFHAALGTVSVLLLIAAGIAWKLHVS